MPLPNLRRIVPLFEITGCLCAALIFMGGCRKGSDPELASAAREQASRQGTEVDSSLRAAVSAAKAGDFARVEELLRPVLLADPAHREALFLLAQSQAARGRVAEAVDTLSSIPSDQSEAALAALGQSADWLIQLGRYQEAERRLRELISQAGDIPRAHRRLAQLLNNLGLRNKAAPHLRMLAQLDAATESELFGMTTFSDPFVHRPEVPGFSEIPPSELCQARNLWYDGKPQEAESLAKKLHEKNRDSVAISAFYGRLLLARQKDSEFLAWLASTPAGIEEEPEYWAAIGNWSQQLGQHDAAIRCFLEAVLRDDTDRHSYLGLARSLQAIGQSEDADRVMSRYKLLDDVAYIASEIKRSPAQLDRIVTLLLQLRRPAEASGWNKVARPSPAALRHASSRETERDEAWITCGIERSNWPLPDLDGWGVPKSMPAVSGSDGAGPIVLSNVASKVGLDMLYQPGPPGTDLDHLVLHQTVGGGVATIDYDLDGWPDLYFTQGAGPAFERSATEPNQLFRNLRGQAFAKIASFAGVDDRGYGQGATSADINQDGFADLVVANIGANVVYINNGDGTFNGRLLNETDNGELWTTSIACGDLTGDQLPDIAEVNYIDDASVLEAECGIPGGGGLCNPQKFLAAKDRILICGGDGTFVSLQTIGSIPRGFGFSALITNIDNQFGNDLFIANDTDPNHLWQSEVDETGANRFRLVQRGELLGCASGPQGNPESCMGIAAGDFDHNGRIDLHVTNYTNESSDLYLQQPSGIFSNEALRFGLESATAPMVGWGTQTSDLNSDGWLDLIVLNGHLYSALTDGTPYRMPPQFFRGSERGFQLATSDSNHEPFWKTPALGRTLARFDWNADGKMDAVAYNMDRPVALLENQSSVGNWLQLELIGTLSERDAVGAIVEIVCSDQTWTAWITAGDGYLCKNESLLHTGIGDETTVQGINVKWPSGNTQSFRGALPNRRYLLVEGQNELFDRSPPSTH